jgi:hypothetical protein
MRMMEQIVALRRVSQTGLLEEGEGQYLQYAQSQKTDDHQALLKRHFQRPNGGNGNEENEDIKSDVQQARGVAYLFRVDTAFSGEGGIEEFREWVAAVEPGDHGREVPAANEGDSEVACVTGPPDDVDISKAKGWLEEVGFQDVQEKLIEVKYGARNSDEDLARKGVWMNKKVVTPLSKFAKSRCLDNCELS